MASGSNNAHSRLRRNGKSNKVTVAAVALPTNTTPQATSRHNTRVVATYSGNTVRAISPRICAVAASHCSHEASTTSTGRHSSRPNSNSRDC